MRKWASTVLPILLTILLSAMLQLSVRAESIRYQNFDSLQTRLADSVLVFARHRLQSILEDSLDFPATVALARTRDEFESRVGSQFPDWGAAAAMPREQLIVIKSPDFFPLRRTLSELLTHEYSHLALGHATSPGSPPRWMDEGLATMIASQWSWEENLLMSKTAVFGTFPSLRAIDDVNSTAEDQAELEYAMSRLAVEFFLERFGTEGMAGFCWALRGGQSREDAFHHASGMSTSQFETIFVAHLRERFDLLTLILDMRFFWPLLALLLVIAAVMRWLSKRSYRARWKEQEKFESTDFDYGDPRRPEQIEDDEPWRGERDRD